VLKGITNGVETHQLKTTTSIKCVYPTCIHFVYGFDKQEHLDLHSQENHPLDMNTPFRSSSTSGDLAFNRLSSHILPKTSRPREDSASALRDHHKSTSVGQDCPERTPSVGQGISRQTSSSSRTSNRTFSFVPEYPAFSGVSPNFQQENTLMHPPKRSRLALDSTDDPKLLKEVGSCLRCKLLKKRVKLLILFNVRLLTLPV
jgi:hypothetical protein